MDFLLDALTNWLKEMLVGGIMGNLTGMFDSVNQQVADIATQVGQTPQGWNGSIFSMIQNLSNSIMVPIAGVILAIVMTLELIQMITDRNNLHDVDTWMIFKWVFKSAAAILLVTNTWNLVMAVFDMAQSVVAQASGIIGSDASIDISAVMTDMESRLMDMDLGPLFGLWFQSLFIGITMWALYICIFIVIYGRTIEIYLVTSVAPIPMATMMGKEWGGMGQNYLRSLLALGFQAFLIIVCVAIYAVLVQNIATEEDIIMAMLSTPHLDEMDENYKRLQYNRYADDFLISITGSKQDAENIKEQVKIFLKDKLNLTMSEEKTHVTHSSEKVRYLGYDIRISRSQDTKRTKKGLQRVWYGKVQLYMPKEKWIAKLHEYGAFKIKKDENGKEIWKPLHRGALMPLDDVAIISKYNSEIRGLYNYYRLAINVCNLGKFHSIMRGSCLKTLAAKYNSSVMKMYKKYRSVKGDFGADYKTKSGTKRCEFYNEGFRRNNNIAPEFVDIMPKYRGQIKPNSLAGRLKSGQCEMCGANPVKVYMHHVKRLKDLNADNEFDELMLLKRRKSLALCPKCYEEAKTKSLKL